MSRRISYLDYLKTNRWKSIRQELFKMRGWKCELCGVKYSLQAHHIDYTNFGNERPFDLVVLCKNCHEKAHLDKFDKKLKLTKSALLIRLFELGFKPQKVIPRFLGIKIYGYKKKKKKGKFEKSIKAKDPYKIKVKNPPVVRLSVLEKWALKDHPKIRFKIK